MTTSSSCARPFDPAQESGVIPTFLVAKDLERGRLVTVLPQYHSLSTFIYIIRPGTREVPRRVRLFSDFLLEYLETHPLMTTPTPLRFINSL